MPLATKQQADLAHNPIRTDVLAHPATIASLITSRNRIDSTWKLTRTCSHRLLFKKVNIYSKQHQINLLLSHLIMVLMHHLRYLSTSYTPSSGTVRYLSNTSLAPDVLPSLPSSTSLRCSTTNNSLHIRWLSSFWRYHHIRIFLTLMKVGALLKFASETLLCLKQSVLNILAFGSSSAKLILARRDFY